MLRSFGLTSSYSFFATFTTYGTIIVIMILHLFIEIKFEINKLSDQDK